MVRPDFQELMRFKALSLSAVSGLFSRRSLSYVPGAEVFARPNIRHPNIVAFFAAALSAGVWLAALPASAQVSGETLFGNAEVNSTDQLLLESDELIYDEANQSVSAVGNVQIAYGKYTLVADRVTYNRTSGRVIAVGNVEIVEPNGNRVFADEIDITDNFQDGFVSALRVETTDNTRFAAESAERREGEIAVYHNGVYTACEPCKEDPSKPPLWQIRANRVIINSRTKRVEYEGASFELFGKPIAYLPRFSHADPSIKRMSGFLFPGFGYDDILGYRVKNSYFWAIAPSYDLTLSGTYYSNQGFLGEAEWRQRTETGEYNLRFAKIDQHKPELFDIGNPPTIDGSTTNRSAVMSNGQFQINPRWRFGWNALYQSDENFARTYKLDGFDDQYVTNEVYLTGINGKNHFDLRAQQFLIQDYLLDQIDNAYSPGNDRRQDQQAEVLPSFDYNLVSDDPIANGQVSLDINVASLSRHKADIKNFEDFDANLLTPGLGIDERHHCIAGDYTRASAELEWKASKILQGGAFVTASLSARGDGIWLNTDNLGTETNPLLSNDSIFRTMPAAMLEIRYPVVASDGLVSHIFEPIAQLIIRPDEKNIGKLPNEDAQSFVFDTTNLFERDKFSGFDRVEGGTRANIGFRYSASFQNGRSIDVIAGQSFHIDGQNSFAQRDLVNAGLESGLETKHSDYVASINLNSGNGLTLGASGRFDEKNADLRRAEVGARYIDPVVALSSSYIFTDAQPNYGFATDRHEARGSASLRLTDYWRVFGGANYDIDNNVLFSKSVGVSYDDSCFSFSLAFNESDKDYLGGVNERSVNFSIGLRTIGDAAYKHALDDGS